MFSFMISPMPARGLAIALMAVLLPWQSLSAQILAQGASPAIKLVVKEGEGALNNIRTVRAKEPVVQVTDASDRPVQGATVSFLLPEIGPSGVFASGSSMQVTTGADGMAVGRGMKPNNVVGEFEVRIVASYRGQTARAVMKQTNVAPRKASGGGGKKAAIILAVLGGAGAGVALGVTRSNKSSTTGPSGTSISAGGSTFGPPR